MVKEHYLVTELYDNEVIEQFVTDTKDIKQFSDYIQDCDWKSVDNDPNQCCNHEIWEEHDMVYSFGVSTLTIDPISYYPTKNNN